MDTLSRSELMNKMYELKFALVDLNLFLDNNPENKKALMDYNSLAEELKRTINIYESQFGPLTNFGCSKSQYPFGWVDEPWPWEYKNQEEV